jgi:hypothetical protein
MKPLDRFLAALGPENYWPSGEGYNARCPVPGHRHGDADPSLTVSEGTTAVLARCHIGHTIEEIAGAVGMKVADLFVRNDQQLRRAKLPVATKNSESGEMSGDLFRPAVVSPACTHCSRNSSHGSPVGFAAASNWSLRSLRSGINSPSCAASVPDAPSFLRSIA